MRVCAGYCCKAFKLALEDEKGQEQSLVLACVCFLSMVLGANCCHTTLCFVMGRAFWNGQEISHHLGSSDIQALSA